MIKINQKIFRLVILLTVLFALSYSPVEAAYYNSGQSGNSEADAYLITSLEDFKLFRDRINFVDSGSGNVDKDPAGKYYRLVTDIDLSNEQNWTAIGRGLSLNQSTQEFDLIPFSGHFDGNGHTINVNNLNASEVSSIFYIVKTESDYAVKNLNIAGDTKPLAPFGAGILIYELQNGVVDHCNYEGNITINSYTAALGGGLINAITGGTVKNCTFSGTINAVSTMEGDFSVEGKILAAGIGGIVGSLEGDGKIENCAALAGSKISVTVGDSSYISYLGGIVGYAYFQEDDYGNRIGSSAGSIKNCTSNAELTGAAYIGGIAGSAYSQTVLSGNSFTNAKYEVGDIDDTGSPGGSSGGNNSNTNILKITTEYIPDGTVNVDYSFTLQASSSGVLWTKESGGLPDGLSLSSTGLISGIPAKSNSFSFTVKATDGANSDTRTFVMRINPAPEVSLNIDIIERGRANDPLSFDRETGLENENIICGISDNNYLDYANNKYNPVTEDSIAKIFQDSELANSYRKKGFTADGNTRLILRAYTTMPGTIKFSVPQEIGASLENLSRDNRGTSIEIKTKNVAGSIYQASAVLISPKDFPQSMLDKFPETNFNVKVNFTGDGGELASKDENILLHSVPVVLIHGFSRTNVDNAFGDFNAASGIRKILQDSGLVIMPCNYDGTKGPMNIIPDSEVENYATNPIFWQISQALQKKVSSGIACTQADLICHSMGGLIARRFIQNDAGNKNTIRSYGNGMIRRVITVATPHEGTPWASLAYNIIRNSSMPAVWELIIDNIPVIKEFFDEIFSPIAQNINYLSAFQDLKLNSDLVKSLKAPEVPFFAIYGGVLNQESEYIALPIFIDIHTIINLGFIEALTEGLKENLLSGKVFMKIVFGPNEEDHDVVVGKSSAVSIFTNNSTGFTGWRFQHTSICKQDDTGREILNLLKGPESKFYKASDSSSNKYALSSLPANIPEKFRSIKTSSEDISYSLNYTLTVKPDNSDSITAPAASIITIPASVKITVSPKDNISDRQVYMLISNILENRLYSTSRDNDGNFTAVIDFDYEDIGALRIACFSGKNEGSNEVYISDAIYLFLVPDNGNITGISFPESTDALFTNVDAEIPISIYAATSSNNHYNIAMPSMGTKWTIEDPSIVSITELGRLKGLKEGSTTITAENNGFKASRIVHVGAAYGTVRENNNQDDSDNNDNPDSYQDQDQNQPYIYNNNRGGGGGCQMNNSGLYAVILILACALFMSKKIS